MLILKTTVQFERDYKLAKKRGLNLQLLNTVLEMLLTEQKLPPKYRNHRLRGKYEGFYECHLQPDWLLIYTINQKTLILTAARTGTHADLL
jgi:mRNA interferase YafQ